MRVIKRFLCLLAVIIPPVAPLMTGCASNAPVTGLVRLEEALAEAVATVERRTRNGDTIALVKMASPLTALSDFLGSELDKRFNAGGKLTVLARGVTLDQVNKEQELQMSGMVSDESAVGIGHFLGANVVITGDFTRFANFSQFSIRAVDVETAQVLAVYSAKITNSDPVLAGITAPLQKTKAMAVSEAALEHLNLGKDYLAAGLHDIAIEEFSKAIAKNRNFAEAWYYRSLAYYGRNYHYGTDGWEDRLKKNKAQALADINHALMLNPNYADAYMRRGEFFYSSSIDDADKAIADFTRYIRLKPDDTKGYDNRAWEYFLFKKDYKRAIADYTQIITLDPDNFFSYSQRGRSYLQIKDYDRAIADFTLLITFGSKTGFSDGYGYYKRAGVYEMMGTTFFESNAVPDYIQAFTLNSSWIGSYYFDRFFWGKPDDMAIDRAIVLFTRVIRLNLNNETTIAAYINRGKVYSEKKDYDKAIADYTQVIRLDPNNDDSGIYFNRGYAYAEKGMYDQAIADYTQVIRLNPNDAVPYNNRGNAYHNKWMYDQAIADYTQAIRLDPNYAMAYNNRGNAYENKGDYNRAIADYEAALRINPDYTLARDNLSLARKARGY